MVATRLNSIQIMRGIAALIVVAFHIRYNLSVYEQKNLGDLMLMNPLMILVKIIKLRWIHILSYDQMVSRKINNQTTRCANSI
ncbi:hypothetical protein L0C50_23075, partial [Salmonella enterica subsp. enterica]|nr:hypothetical protein [Salmonella enterica subsp. enterica]MDG0226212.1 hypothetical protein [Salmonella enterica subsp. enterica]MDG0237738.1 hypothetical protein [Salmonella enterica subsp. enterica]MDG0241062.1 hypothetical protein [Salmonella enterica subsp. enterica]